ncbi:PAS domain S-box protein [Geomesophilobacter sediminis]|uniref:histidine kinase n=1 Tax=Geomesophilobacter sediminis TaxID=2798584 RepID=A0A8J7LU39_9BACT|nr:PAS domain S-box protein [Geomesophilobacter sediminis]MBJ6724184.1 PAS domain S-box protein [Geomesophilobacter sediminis]
MQDETLLILLIEDEPAEAILIKEMLEQQAGQKYSVEHVQYLEEALARLEDRIFDCILVDLGLPDSQGIETALAVRNQAKWTPVAIITILDDEEIARQALDMDIQDYLIKGEITKTILARSIRYAIQRKHNSEKLRESEARFASFMLHMPVAAWMKDMGGRYAYANAEAERIFARPLEAVLGKTDRDLFPEEIARQFAENDSRTLGEGGTVQTTERYPHADGTEHRSLVDKFVMRSPDGQPAFIAGIALDITERLRAEDALRESEEKFSKIFNSVPVGITISDLADGRFVEINQEGERLSGYQRDEVIGHLAEEFLVWKSADERAAMVEQALKEGSVRDRETTFYTKEGKLLHAFYSATIVNLGGKRHLLSMVSDITERRRVEKAIKESEERFRALVMASSQALYRMSPDWSTMLQLYSQAFLESNEGPNSNWLQQYIHPDDQPQMTAAIQEAIKEKRIFELQHRIRRADGSLGWTSSRAVPLINGSGEIVEWFGAASDITESKMAEEAVRRAKEEWERTFDAVPDLIAILDGQNRFVRLNRAMAERLGRPPAECLGLLCHVAIHGTDYPPGFCPHILTMADRNEHATEVFEANLGGHFLVSTTPLVSPDGKLDGVVHVARDITELKLAQEKIETLNQDLEARAAELEEANSELQAFSYSAAHDLKQPLNIINGYCQAIMMMWGDRLDEVTRGYLSEAIRGTVRMSRLISSLLTFSQMGHIDLHRETVDLSRLALAVMEDLRAADPGRHVTTRIADGVVGTGDPSLMRVALENLLGNAWKYSCVREEAIIEFGLAEIDGETTYFVRDNGPGFNKAEAEVLFLPFKRLKGYEEIKGFGIGLATVERIIRRHGGKVWAEGIPDQGATFWFTLPVSV